MRTGMGVSTIESTTAAITEAICEATTQLDTISLICIFFTGNHDPKIIREVALESFKDISILGASIAGIFTESQVLEKCIAVLALSGVEAQTILIDNPALNKSEYLLGQDVGKHFTVTDKDCGTVFVFPSIKHKRIGALLRGVYDALGNRYEYCGAGSEIQFTEDDFADNGLVLAIIKGIEITNSIGHGWAPFGEPMLVTRTDGNKILELDGQPVMQRYLEIVNENSESIIGDLIPRYQLGIPCGNGEYVIRDVIDYDETSLITSIEVPQNSVVTLMTTSISILPAIARRVTQECINNHSNPEFALLFECISRKMLLGDLFINEVNNIYQVLSGLPTLGLLTYGEISSPKGVPMYYQQILSVVIGGESIADKGF